MDKSKTLTRASREELRKQKLMEYLKAKGRLKDPSQRSYLKDTKSLSGGFVKKSFSEKDKENKANPTGHNGQHCATIPNLKQKIPLQAGGTTCTSLGTGSRRTQHLIQTTSVLKDKPLLTSTAPAYPRSRSTIKRKAVSSSTGVNEMGPVGNRTTQASSQAGKLTGSSMSTSGAIKGGLNVGGKAATCRVATSRAPTKAQSNTPGVAQSRKDSATSKTRTLYNSVAVKSAVQVGPFRPVVVETKRAPVRSCQTQRVCVNTQPTLTKLASSNNRVKDVPGNPYPVDRSRKVPQAKANGQSVGFKQSQNPSAPKNSALQRHIREAKLGSRAEPGAPGRGIVGMCLSVPESGLKNRKNPVVSSTICPTQRQVQPKHVKSAHTKTGPSTATDGQKGQRKMTAAQEERLRKLQEWREAKGISYKRPPMPIKPSLNRTSAPQEHYWKAMEEEDEAQQVVCSIDRSLSDCIKLLREGCSTEQVRTLISRLPMARKFAKYWICQAMLMEREGNLNVLPMFQEAVRVVLEPVDELRTVVFELLKKKEEAQDKTAPGLDKNVDAQKEGMDQVTTPLTNMATPKGTNVRIHGTKEGSSIVKYRITATPGGRKSQRREPARVDGQELLFFTPVRRSVRIERAAHCYPITLHEHDPCVASFRDLLDDEQQKGDLALAKDSTLYIYRENEALGDQVYLQVT